MASATTQHFTANALSRTERLAVRLFPHRASLLAAGLGLFLLSALPLVRVAHGDLGLDRWHAVLFGAGVPVVLWALSLGCVAIFFHPVHGLVGRVEPGWSPQSPWLRKSLRAYATFTVWAFAVAPVVVLVAAVG
jgi:hypothetical protein